MGSDMWNPQKRPVMVRSPSLWGLCRVGWPVGVSAGVTLLALAMPIPRVRVRHFLVGFLAGLVVSFFFTPSRTLMTESPISGGIIWALSFAIPAGLVGAILPVSVDRPGAKISETSEL